MWLVHDTASILSRYAPFASVGDFFCAKTDMVEIQQEILPNVDREYTVVSILPANLQRTSNMLTAFGRRRLSISPARVSASIHLETIESLN